MEGTIFDIKRFALHDGPGIRTTIFFQGCPLRCRWCHNPESLRSLDGDSKQFIDRERIESKLIDGGVISIDQLMDLIKRDLPYFEESGGGVTCSGGEATVQHPFLIKFLERLQDEGIHTTLDSCGYCEPNIFKRISQFCDHILYDLKIIDGEQHRLYTDSDNRWILENLRYLVESKRSIEIRYPFIPEVNGVENFNSTLDLLNSIGYKGSIDILPYHNLGTHKRGSMRRFRVPDRSEVEKLISTGEKRGFEIFVGGKNEG